MQRNFCRHVTSSFKPYALESSIMRSLLLNISYKTAIEHQADFEVPETTP